MFCRNCGKELIGSPEICPGCGARPMRGNSFCSNCGAPTTPLTEMCVKCGVRVVERVEAGLQKMNWFQRHLNWTVVLAWLLAFVVSFIVGLGVFFAIAVAYPYISYETLEGASYLAALVAGLAVLLPTWGWVLKRKNRSLWWLLLVFLVPFGWIAMFALENRSR